MVLQWQRRSADEPAERVQCCRQCPSLSSPQLSSVVRGSGVALQSLRSSADKHPSVYSVDAPTTISELVRPSLSAEMGGVMAACLELLTQLGTHVEFSRE